MAIDRSANNVGVYTYCVLLEIELSMLAVYYEITLYLVINIYLVNENVYLSDKVLTYIPDQSCVTLLTISVYVFNLLFR